jgi:CysZ protein
MKDFFAGAGFLFRGIRGVARRPKLVLLGIIPAIISMLLFIAAFVALFYNIDTLAEGSTDWFARSWDEGLRTAVRVAAGAAIVAVAVLLAIVSYAGITLLIGDPFYEAIAEAIEDQLGGVPNEVEVPWYSSLRRSLTDSLRLVFITILVGIPLFFGGLIPVVGQTVVPVIAALVGGWFLTQELVGIPFQRRGLRLPDRRKMLRQHKMLSLGFGTAVFVCFLIPLGAILIMPAAVAGGSLLTRELFGLNTK